MRAYLKAMLTVCGLFVTVALGQTKPVVVLIATGGTIAMKIAAKDRRARVMQLSQTFQLLLQQLR